MRKIIFQTLISIDGFFEGPHHEIDWHNVDQEFNEFAKDFLNSVDVLLFGRVTYQLMAGYWPTSSAKEDDPIIASKMNSLAKIVFSKTLNKAEWENTRLVKDNIIEEISELKKQPGKDMAIFGSSDLALTLMRHGLIDEYRILVSPIILGDGKSLFKGVNERIKFKLIKTHTFKSGNVMLYYRAVDA